MTQTEFQFQNIQAKKKGKQTQILQTLKSVHQNGKHFRFTG